MQSLPLATYQHDDYTLPAMLSKLHAIHHIRTVLHWTRNRHVQVPEMGTNRPTVLVGRDECNAQDLNELLLERDSFAWVPGLSSTSEIVTSLKADLVI